MSVPLLDLQRQYEPFKEEAKQAILDVFDSKQFINGPKVTELEEAIATYTETKHAIGVSSGTDALVLSLMALNIGHGDEVITTPFTFFATAGSIHRVGATPVFVDINPETYNIDPSLIEAKITPNTKAIMPVHLFGQMADMDAIMAIADKHNLAVIEDAAQAIGSRFQDKAAGSIGTVGCFSFFPSKNLGACGDAGIVTTNDDVLAEKLRLYKSHGAKQKYYHDFVGGNFRLDPMQAAVLSVKLPYLEGHHEGRIQNAQTYNDTLHPSVKRPVVDPRCRMIYNQYTISTPERDALKAYLDERKIGNAVYYPVPLHIQNCFAPLGYKEGDLPHSERAAKEVISIPVFGELTAEEVSEVKEAINSFIESRVPA